MKKFKPVLFLISLSLFFAILNGYVIAQPSKKQLEAFRSAKTVQIVVEQSYGEAKDVSLPIMDAARKLLEYAGLQVVGSNVKEYDLYIKIEAEGEALSRSYTPGVKLYTGASLAGSILFKIPDIPIYEKSFDTYQSPPLRSPPYAISGSIEEYRVHSGAPFEELLYGQGTVVSKIVEMMTEIYGITSVIAGLKDEDIQDSTAYALGEIKDPQTVEPLIAALKHEDEGVRAHAARALGYIKDPRAVEPLIAALKDEDEDRIVRAHAAHALGEIKDPRTVEPLIAALKDEDWFVRTGAAIALSQIKDLRAVEPLIAVLKDEDEDVREHAAQAFGYIKDPRAVEPLIAALKDEDEAVRAHAAHALGKIKDPHAVGALIAVLKDNHEYIRYLSAIALEDITQKQFGENQEEWKKWWKENKEEFIKKK